MDIYKTKKSPVCETLRCETWLVMPALVKYFPLPQTAEESDSVSPVVCFTATRD